MSYKKIIDHLLKFSFIFFVVGSTANAQELIIGTQTWTSKNLDVTKFRNGDVIEEVQGLTAWQKAGEEKRPAWSYYDNDPANGKVYGKMYNWYAVIDPRGLAPEGWHIPATKEWNILVEFLGGANAAVAKLKSTSKWSNNENGTNESGFNGLPGGYRSHRGMSENFGVEASWWSTSEKDADRALYWGTETMLSLFSEYYANKKAGYYVRCVKD